MMRTRKHPRQRIGLGLPSNGAGGRRLPQQPPLIGGAESGTDEEAEREMGLATKLPD